MRGPTGKEPEDYKFFCFNGEPAVIQVDLDRFTNHQRVFYDLSWKKQPFGLLYPYCERVVSKPDNLATMIDIAKKLSEGIRFCRVDLYSWEKKTIFGEITFFPECGFGRFYPQSYDLHLGHYLTSEE